MPLEGQHLETEAVAHRKPWVREGKTGPKSSSQDKGKIKQGCHGQQNSSALRLLRKRVQALRVLIPRTGESALRSRLPICRESRTCRAKLPMTGT